MFITLNIEGKNTPVVINTEKIFHIEYNTKNKVLYITFDHQVESQIDGVSEKEYITLLRNLSIVNQH